jgi:hypothetical protein
MSGQDISHHVHTLPLPLIGGGIPMGLTNKKEEQLKKMPRIESKLFKSKDGKWIIQRTIISSIKPVNYFKKMIDGEPQMTLEDFDDSPFFQQEGHAVMEY